LGREEVTIALYVWGLFEFRLKIDARTRDSEFIRKVARIAEEIDLIIVAFYNPRNRHFDSAQQDVEAVCEDQRSSEACFAEKD